MDRAVRMGLTMDWESEAWQKWVPEMVRHVVCCSNLFSTFDIQYLLLLEKKKKKSFIVSIFI